MTVDFHKEMDKYLASKRRKKVFSGIKSRVMNKKSVVSCKAKNRFLGLKGKLASKVEEIKKRKKEAEKEIRQEDINELVERGGIKREPKKEEYIEEKEEGWKEVKLEEVQGEEGDLDSLEEEKRKIRENLSEMENREREEKEKIARLSEEKEQREKYESEEEKIRRLELEEEVSILKEKQRIEEDRLTELRKARRREQMDVLRGRVMDILFKKRSKKEKNVVEEVRREIRAEARIKEAERKNIEGGKPKEDVVKTEEQPKEERTKNIIPNISSALERIFGKPQHHQVNLSTESLNRRLRLEKKKELKVEKQREAKEKEPEKSFFSSFIQIKTAAQIAREEGERLRREEEQAFKDQSEIEKLFQSEGEVMVNVQEEQNVNIFSTLFPEGAKTNIAKEPSDVNLSTLFPGEIAQQASVSKEETIDLGGDYKIRVVKNR